MIQAPVKTATKHAVFAQNCRLRKQEPESAFAMRTLRYSVVVVVPFLVAFFFMFNQISDPPSTARRTLKKMKEETSKNPDVFGVQTNIYQPPGTSPTQNPFQYDLDMNLSWRDTQNGLKLIQQLQAPRVRSVVPVPSVGEMSGPSKNDINARTRSVGLQCNRLSRFKSPGGFVHELMTNRRSGLAYCYVPKCGCTFWKRIIRFLNRDFAGRNVTSPFQIRRFEVHNNKFYNPDSSLPFSVYRNISKLYQSFMFVREPYSRLWSAYIDKLYLPDFWREFLHIISRWRRVDATKNCDSEVSFSEFLLLSLETEEPHWDPIYTMCDPCLFKPSFVGRMENFTADSKFILEQADVSWLMEGYNHQAHVQEEMSTLIKYNVELMAYKPQTANCTSKLGLFRRLWKTFQINGYLPEDAFPQNLHSGTTTYQFIQIVLNHYRRRPNTPDVWRAQREKFMTEAYRAIPMSTLHAIRMKYARDFILFNYDPRPPKIFGNRT